MDHDTQAGARREPDVLLVAVNYESTDATCDFLKMVGDDPDRGRVGAVLADNSPTTDPRLPDAAAAAGVRYVHLPSNPAFSGAARHVLSRLVAERAGPLPYVAVVLCNVDIEFRCGELAAIVDAARTHTGDTRWMLAPDIVEPGRAYRVNPQSMRRPERHNGRLRHRLRRHSYRFDVAFRWLWLRHRRTDRNPNADLPQFTRMYSAGGAFMVFGAGFFTAGGVFHESPLFSEEYGFAEQAHHLDVPVLYMPQMVVTHEFEVSTSAERRGHRQRHEWHVAADRFYRAWSPRYVIGSMSTWFAEPD